MNKHIRIFLSWLAETDWNPATILITFLFMCFISISTIMHYLFVDSVSEAALIAFVCVCIVLCISWLTGKLVEIIPTRIFPFNEYKKRNWHHIKLCYSGDADAAMNWWKDNGKGLASKKWDTVSLSNSNDAVYIKLKWGGDCG